MKLILGLGNPGVRFRFSRHNLGFLVIEKLAKAQDIKINQKAFNNLLGRGTIGKKEVILGFPQTFMNQSQAAVLPIVRQKKISLADLLIVCDDVNLPLGKIRIRARGSDGGHKGLRSIIEALGTEVFARLRIGVGQKARGNLSQYVLSRFRKKEINVINQAVEQAVDCCELWVKDGIQAAMNRFN